MLESPLLTVGVFSAVAASIGAAMANWIAGHSIRRLESFVPKLFSQTYRVSLPDGRSERITSQSDRSAAIKRAVERYLGLENTVYAALQERFDSQVSRNLRTGPDFSIKLPDKTVIGVEVRSDPKVLNLKQVRSWIDGNHFDRLYVFVSDKRGQFEADDPVDDKIFIKGFNSSEELRQKVAQMEIIEQ